MQLESKDFYKLVTEKYGIPVELVKSIGDCVFRELADLQKDPPNLILDVRKLGRRFVRKKKVYERLEKSLYDRQDIANGTMRFPKDKEEVDKEIAILIRLQQWYEYYLEDKAHRKTLRREYSSSAQPDTTPQTLRTAGPNNPGEHERLHPGEHEIPGSEAGIPETSHRD